LSFKVRASRGHPIIRKQTARSAHLK
jgi:hypothetical protein